MATSNPSAAPGLLESFLAGDRRQALATGGDIDPRPRGAGLFADISGFTPLTEALAAALGPQRGAEELNSNLNRIYQGIIDDLAAHGGVVLYFSGDAITCWIDGDDGSRAAACGLAMQRTMLDVGRVTTSTGDVIELSIKVAVAVGDARRFAVGDPQVMQLDVLAGRLIDQLAAAEQLATTGDVILDQSALDSLGSMAEWSEIRTDDRTGRRCGVLTSVVLDEQFVLADDVRSLLPTEVTAQWLLPDVFSRLTAGAGDFLAELRTVYPMFIRFGGFEYDDERAVAGLDEFIRRMQQIFVRYEGDLLGITVGDKGAYVNAVFGALRSHEDDAQRAAVAALDISQLEHATDATDVQIGISVGRVYSGTYGHADRRTYTILGDPTNLAARLMMAAPPGEIYVSEGVARPIDRRFFWTDLPPLKLKGKAARVPARSLLGRRRNTVQRHLRYPHPMIGRERELAQVHARLDQLAVGENQVIGVSARAGVGKSRFVAEVLLGADHVGLPVAYGEAEALGGSTPYLVWRGITRTLFDIDDDAPDPEQRRRVEHVLGQLDGKLLLRAPLLSAVLAVDIPDNEVTTHFDAKLRKASLESLLADLLRHRLAAGPLLVVLEDLHWTEPSSVDLLHILVRSTRDLPVAFLLAYRDEPGNDIGERVADLPGFHHVALHELDEAGIGAVIDTKIRQVFGDAAHPSEPLLQLVRTRAGGNPFYAEEIVNYVHRQGFDPADPSAVNDVDLPDSLEAIVLSRVDTLDERPRQTLKVASVVGHEFDAALLPDIHELGGGTQIIDHLRHLQRADLVVPYGIDEVTWRFRHAITREVAYSSIPFALRAPLHESVGTVIEERDPEGVEFNLDVLAHHFWHSDNLAKKQSYLARTGDAAKDAYANTNAVLQFGRLAELTDGSEKADALIKLTRVLGLMGDWSEAERSAAEARAVADAADDVLRLGWSDVELGELARKRGRFGDAVEHLDTARASFETGGDAGGEARVLHLLGTISAQQGELLAARDSYERSREIRTRLDDRRGLADILTNLGIVAEYEGDYTASEAFHRQALDVREEIGDKERLVNSYTNLGMIAYLQDRFDEARPLFEHAMKLGAEVGDDWMVALTHHNLANANRGLGDHDAARGHFIASAAAYRTFDDRWALAQLFEDIALLAAALDAPMVAMDLVGAADRLRVEIDSPAPETARSELLAGIERAATEAGELDEARQRGFSRPLDEALAVALRFCDGEST